MYGFVSIFDVRSAVSELSNRRAFVTLSGMNNKQALQARWSTDFGFDSIEKVELAQILEKKCQVKLLEKTFSVSSDTIGDFLRAVNIGDNASKEMTLSKLRSAFDVLSDDSLAERVSKMPNQSLLESDIYKDLGVDSLDVVELIMHLEKQNDIEIPFDVEEKMTGGCTVAKIIELVNKFSKPAHVRH